MLIEVYVHVCILALISSYFILHISYPVFQTFILDVFIPFILLFFHSLRCLFICFVLIVCYWLPW